MTIISITVSDESNPTEIQAWLDANPGVTVNHVANDGRVFFIFYS